MVGVAPRFYYESDGGPGRQSHYVVDRYADPLGDHRRVDFETRRLARKAAKEMNASPPWAAWDTIQVARDAERA